MYFGRVLSTLLELLNTAVAARIAMISNRQGKTYIRRTLLTRIRRPTRGQNCSSYVYSKV